MAQYRLQVNGRTATVESWDPAQPLLYVLRNALGLHSPKFGCGLGQCGACTVLLDGTPTRSCITSVEQAVGLADGGRAREFGKSNKAAEVAEDAAREAQRPFRDDGE